MRMMLKILHNLINVSAADGDPNDHCTLLVKIMRPNLSTEEEVVTVKRSEIQQTCEAFANADDAVEVTVFQQVFHARKEPIKADEITDDTMLAATTAISVMGL